MLPLDTLLQPAPDFGSDIFNCWHDAIERLHLAVEEAVVHRLDDFLIKNFFQLAQIEDHPRYRMGIALHGNLQNVIMAVAMGIGVGAVYPAVVFCAPSRIGADVGRGKFRLPSNSHGTVVGCYGETVRSSKIIAWAGIRIGF